MNKKISFAAVLITAAGLMAAGVVPALAASAPTLPSNQHFFAIDCDGFGPLLWSVDSLNGNATTVGTPLANGNACAGGAQANPVDGKVYYVYWPQDGSTPDSLNTVDTTTGVSTRVANFTGATQQPLGLAITKTGTAYVTTGTSSGSLYSLSLDTGAMTLIGALGANLGAVGYNPVDDTIYGFSYVTGDAYTVDTVTGAATADAAHNAVLPGKYTCPNGALAGLALDAVVFDSNGNPWFQNDGSGCLSELLVQDFATGTVYYNGQFNDNSPTRLMTNSPYYGFYTMSIFITTDPIPTSAATPGPALAETGLNSANTGLFAGGAALVALLGTAVVFATRGRNARN
jgi:hypothetical protein